MADETATGATSIPVAEVPHARQTHQSRQREGHKLPDWDGLSDAMRAELIFRAERQISSTDRDADR